MAVRLCFLFVAVLLLLTPWGRAAQQAAVPPKPTLAQSLAAAKPPAQGVALAVGAERVTLPDASALPPAGASLGDAAAAFGYQTRAFGVVQAVAPETMVVLNDNPAAPDVTADLNSYVAFRMLIAGLDDAQWQALTSEQGLGLSDLSDDTQHGLFHALFRQGRLRVASDDPAQAKLPEAQRTDILDFTDQIDSARLRLGQTAHLYLHDSQGKTIFFSGSPPAAGRLKIFHSERKLPQERYGVTLRAVVSNVPKSGDLKFNDAALQGAVPLAGLRTVGDLAARVAAGTRLEIYADPHYAKRSLTLLSSAPSAPAGDLLRALALCVTGTYRHVGPAYVLTDDLVGVGTRRKRLADWDKVAMNTWEQLLSQSGQAMLEHRVSQARAIPSFGDALGLTPEQMKALPDSFLPGVPGDVDVPVAQLTPAQQDRAKQIAADYNAARAAGALPSYLTDENLQAADTQGKVNLRAQTQVQIVLPSLSTPIDTELAPGPLELLFYPGEKAANEFIHKTEADKPAKAPPVLPPAPPLAPLLHSVRRRAVLAHPRTVADVDALVVAMQKIGLNELWLDVFSAGVSHVSGKPDDILTEALARTRGTGIVVYADLSLLFWGDSPPADVADLNILGENSREEFRHAQALASESDTTDDDGKPIPLSAVPVEVSPAATVVGDTLASLVRRVAGRPGLAGFVWEDAEVGDDFGYAPEMRLRFLRQSHADPIDITPDVSPSFDVSLPEFDDDAAEKSLKAQWDTARTSEASAALLARLRQAAGQVNPGLPILMEQSTDAIDWLASWDAPTQIAPPLRPLGTDEAYPPPNQVAAIARRQSRAVLLHESVGKAATTDDLARALAKDLKTGRWDGFVLDFEDEAATRGSAPLADLISAASKENRQAK